MTPVELRVKLVILTLLSYKLLLLLLDQFQLTLKMDLFNHQTGELRRRAPMRNMDLFGVLPMCGSEGLLVV
jgi:hypothetical protein